MASIHVEVPHSRGLPSEAAVAGDAGAVAAALDGRGLTRILPGRGWQPLNVSELWRYRELLFFLGWRDVKVRYKQTALGAAWAVLQPAMMMVVFTVFFSRMAKVSSGDFPYPVFVYAGLLPWTFFASAITHAGLSVTGSERLITKIYFPRLAIPLASVGAAVVDFFVAFGLMVGLMIYYGVAPTPQLLVAPLAFAAIVMAALGVGILMAALNVAYRDFRYVLPFLVQIWLFATPSVYMNASSAGQKSGVLRALLAANPMTNLVATFRDSVLGNPIQWGPFGLSAAAVAVLFVCGCLYFRRVEDGFADVI